MLSLFSLSSLFVQLSMSICLDLPVYRFSNIFRSMTVLSSESPLSVHLILSFIPFLLCIYMYYRVWWLNGKSRALRSDSHRFESHSSRHVGRDLWQVLH